MNAFYFKPPFGAPKEREEVLLSSLLSTKVAEGNYPGDATPSNNWPNVAPGARGMNNAISPKHCDLGGFARVDPKPPVLWIRGADDALVSDTSLLDFGYLGQIGVVPGWPGEEVYPPQPMVSQARAVLEAYVQNGGSYREELIEDCGHSPHVEKPEAFRQPSSASSKSIPNHIPNAKRRQFGIPRYVSALQGQEDAPGCSVLALAGIVLQPSQRERAGISPRFPCFAKRRADLMKVLQDLPVGPEHAGLVVSDCVNATEGFDD